MVCSAPRKTPHPPAPTHAGSHTHQPHTKDSSAHAPRCTLSGSRPAPPGERARGAREPDRCEHNNCCRSLLPQQQPAAPRKLAAGGRLSSGTCRPTARPRRRTWWRPMRASAPSWAARRCRPSRRRSRAARLPAASRVRASFLAGRRVKAGVGALWRRAASTVCQRGEWDGQPPAPHRLPTGDGAIATPAPLPALCAPEAAAALLAAAAAAAGGGTDGRRRHPTIRTHHPPKTRARAARPQA